MFPYSVRDWLLSRLEDLVPEKADICLEYLEMTLVDQCRSDSLFDQCADYLQDYINNPGQISDLLNELFGKIEENSILKSDLDESKSSPEVSTSSHKRAYRFDSDSEEDDDDDFDERPRRRARLHERERKGPEETPFVEVERFNNVNKNNKNNGASNNNINRLHPNQLHGRIAAHVTNSGNSRFVDSAHSQEHRPRELVSIGTTDFKNSRPRQKFQAQGFENTRPNNASFRRNQPSFPPNQPNQPNQQLNQQQNQPSIQPQIQQPSQNQQQNGQQNSQPSIHQHQPRQQRTRLVLKNIPQNLNNEADIRSHFNPFGDILNCVSNLNNDPQSALLEFASHESAFSAYKSPAAILGNRFIRIYWENPKYNNRTNANGNPNANANLNDNENQQANSTTVQSNSADSTTEKTISLPTVVQPPMINGKEPYSVPARKPRPENYLHPSHHHQPYPPRHHQPRHRMAHHPAAAQPPQQNQEEVFPVVIPVKVMPPHQIFKLKEELARFREKQEENMKNQKLLLEKLERADSEKVRSSIARILGHAIKTGEEIKEQIQSVESALASGQPNKYIAPNSNSNEQAVNRVTEQNGALEVYD